MIDEGFARSYIDSNVSPDAELALSSNEREELFETALTIDAAGLSPGAAGYEETYSYTSLYQAIHEGWLKKRAKAAELHEGDEKVIFDHCQEMVEYWAGRVTASITSEGIGVSGQSSMAIPNVAVW